MQFLSPTVNLWMSPSDYIKFAENLEEYLRFPFEDGTKEENYPVGIVGEIKLHCIHYKDFTEAKRKWESRCKRVNKERIILTMTDQNGCTLDQVNRFAELPYPKIFFTSMVEYKNFDFAVYMDSMKYRKSHTGRTLVDDAFLFDGFTGKRNYEKYFNICEFLNRNGF